MHQSLFERIDACAEATSWLYGAAQASAGYRVGLFAGLLLGGWWIGRGSDEGTRVAGTITAGGATLLVMAVDQPIVRAALLTRLLPRRPVTHLVGAMAGTRLRPFLVTASQPRPS
jgi:hypothetical protein